MPGSSQSQHGGKGLCGGGLIGAAGAEHDAVTAFQAQGNDAQQALAVDAARVAFEENGAGKIVRFCNQSGGGFCGQPLRNRNGDGFFCHGKDSPRLENRREGRPEGRLSRLYFSMIPPPRPAKNRAAGAH